MVPPEVPETSRLKRVALLLCAGLPLVFFGHLLLTQGPPPEAMAQTLNLHGTWKVLPGETPGGERPETDDRAAPDIRVPGSYRFQGFRERDAWLRRRFEAPASLTGQPLFLMLSDTRSGRARIFLNGRFIGETEPTPIGPKTEVTGVEGWSVPADVLRPGENVLAVHFHWAFLGADGIHNDRVLLGPEGPLQRYYLELGDERRLLQYGAGFLMGFLVLLFGALLTARWSTPNRPLYLSCIALLVAATAFLGVNAGVFFQVPATSPWGAALVYLTVLALFYTQPNFIIRYVRGPRDRFRVWHARLCAAFLAGFVLTFAMGWEAAASVIFVVLNAYAFVPVAYMTVITLGAQLRRPLSTDIILASGLLCSVMSGVGDMAHDIGLGSDGLMYPVGAAACAIVAAVVLIADFTKVSFDNLALSHSLKRTNADLADALVRAQEAAQLKSEFVATVSHELRTPLNSVLNIPEGLLATFSRIPGARCGRCQEQFELEAGDTVDATSVCPACSVTGSMVAEEVFRFSGDSSNAVKGLRQVHRAGTHLLSLIDDVLDFSKLEAGRMKLALEWLDVGAALRNVQETLEPLALKKKNRLVVEAPSEGGRLQADPVKLAQIFINLVGNALKFSPEGAEVRVHAEAHGDQWRFGVRDRGIGIAPEHHATIFESFRQVDGSHTRKFGGTGLGLAITRKLAEAHGGRVWLESALGQGSTFFVELPREGPADQPAEALPQPVPAAAMGRTVLILDDERLAVENLRLILKPLGHRVEGIQDPRALEEALTQHKPDLLILDVMLPGVSGLDILRALNARQSQIPVLVSSAYHANMDVVRALGASWLQKPWRSDELQGEVTRLLLGSHLKAVG